MGSPQANKYLASLEVVAASALVSTINRPDWYEQPTEWSGVVRGGDGTREENLIINAEEALQKIIGQLDSMVEAAEGTIDVGERPAVEAMPTTRSTLDVWRL